MNLIQMSRVSFRPLLVAICAALALPAAASAGVTTQYNGGSLQVDLTAGDDAAIACVSGKVKVNATIYGAASCSSVSAILVNGDGGNNVIDLSGVVSPFDDDLLSGDVVVHGGDGADDIEGSWADPETTTSTLAATPSSTLPGTKSFPGSATTRSRAAARATRSSTAAAPFSCATRRPRSDPASSWRLGPRTSTRSRVSSWSP
jgi:hypothetical protein